MADHNPKRVLELSAGDLRRQADPAALGFDSTADLDPAQGDTRQPRAEQALAFGVSMRFDGYNVYALGAPQIGMHEFVLSRLQAAAAERQAPDDWCYLNDFDDLSSPRSCRLPPGIGRRLKHDVAEYLSAVRATLPAALKSEDFRRQAAELGQRLQQRQLADTSALQEEADGLGLTMLPTPNGFVFAPVEDGKVMEHSRYTALDQERRQEIDHNIEQMNSRLLERLHAYPMLQEQLIREQRQLTRDTASRVLESLAATLRKRYQGYPEVMAFVLAAQADLLENTERLLMLDQGESFAEGMQPGAARAAADQFFRQYHVNLIVDNADLEGAPVVYESNPSLDNLLGKLEHRFEFGMPVTDFNMIRGGALHRANGGFLLVDADRLLQKPFAWEALKRVLADRALRIESVGQMLNLTYSVSLDPRPIDLDVKVVLLGDRRLYHLLRQHDADFDSLFKIVADFDDYVPWDDDQQHSYAALLARLVAESGIRHLTAAAVASTLEQSSRLADDQRRLSARVRDLQDILREADQLAGADGDERIDAHHIDAVIAGRAYRVDRVRELIQENIRRGVILVETRGARIGQVNGLSVAQIGKLVFGQPARITATARLGHDKLIDIEREARLGGRLHSKAVLIVANFIGARYAREHPLPLHASLVFEQSYGGIEGDSASVAEVCALLSAIIQRPIRQDIAITGSMDQHGRAQAIGGVNEKIEGFFDTCSDQGLSGSQGVIIPAGNRDNLMLRQDVVDAVTAGTFHVYTMVDVDDALTLLFGEPGGPNADPAQVHAAVEARIRALHQRFLETAGRSTEED